MTNVNEELRRLVNLLPNTPPGDNYIRTLQCIECLGGLADTIDEVLGRGETPEAPNVIRLMPKAEGSSESDTSEPSPCEPEATMPGKAPTYTRADVRAMLGGLRLEGNSMDQLLAEFGAKNFSEIPEERYADVMSYAKEHF